MSHLFQEDKGTCRLVVKLKQYKSMLLFLLDSISFFNAWSLLIVSELQDLPPLGLEKKKRFKSHLLFISTTDV